MFKTLVKYIGEFKRYESQTKEGGDDDSRE